MLFFLCMALRSWGMILSCCYGKSTFNEERMWASAFIYNAKIFGIWLVSGNKLRVINYGWYSVLATRRAK